MRVITIELKDQRVTLQRGKGKEKEILLSLPLPEDVDEEKVEEDLLKRFEREVRVAIALIHSAWPREEKEKEEMDDEEGRDQGNA